jgi:hypothetical protein
MYIDNGEPVVPKGGNDLKPSCSANGQVRGYVDAVDRMLSSVRALAVGAGVCPSWIRVAKGDCLAQTEIGTGEHGMELAACHIFISINENYYSFPVLSPFQELSTNILQENIAWAALDAHMVQLPALLTHYSKITTTSASAARDVDGKDPSHVSLMPFKLHPCISS